MPAAGKISSASMNAEPTMPKTCVTPFAASVSTSASEGPIFCGWVTGTPPVSGFLQARWFVSLRSVYYNNHAEYKYHFFVALLMSCLSERGLDEQPRPVTAGRDPRNRGRNLLDTQGLRCARGPGARRACRHALRAHAGYRAAEADAAPHARAVRGSGLPRPRARRPRLYLRITPVGSGPRCAPQPSHPRRSP